MNNWSVNSGVAAVAFWLRAAGCAVLCFFSLLVTPLAGAAGWSIDPVRIVLLPEHPAAITVGNDSDEPTSIQVQAVAWTQLDGKDVYTPTRELLVSPPIFTIAPHSEQVIRVALRRQADPAVELAYRINLQELPPQPKPGLNGLQVALRIGLPVFVPPKIDKDVSKMVWKISRMPDQKLKIGLTNHGNEHIQVSDFSIYVPGSDKPIASEAGSSYVLPGQAREWLVKLDSTKKIGSDRVHFKAYTDAGNIDTDIVLGKP